MSNTNENLLSLMSDHIRDMLNESKNFTTQPTPGAGTIVLNFFYMLASANISRGGNGRSELLQKAIPLEKFSDQQLIAMGRDVAALSGTEIKDMYERHSGDAYCNLRSIVHQVPGRCETIFLPYAFWVYLLDRNPSSENIDMFLDYLYDFEINWKTTRFFLKSCPYLFEIMTSEQLGRLSLDAKRIVPILYELHYYENKNVSLPKFYNDFIDNGLVALKLSGNKKIPPTLLRQVKIVKENLCP